MSTHILAGVRILSCIALGLVVPAGPALAQATPPVPLEGTYWRATELAGKSTPKQDPNREAHLRFDTNGRVSGSDGCNRVTGTYKRSGNRVTFSQMASTQMACIDATATEQPFHDALKNAARLKLAGDHLELLDAHGARLGVFAAASEPSAHDTGITYGLAGTSWQLVKFEGGDDTKLVPDDPAKYTIEFRGNGELFARIDCNRGHGTWKMTSNSQIQFGPLALTRAMCPPGSMHDQIVRQWPFIRSFVIRDGHLFLALMADGGIYEFEPAEK